MFRHSFILLFFFALLSALPAQAQECFFLKNVLDTIYRVEPANGIVSADSLPTDFPGQSFFGYLATIDAIGRRYMFVSRTSPTNFNDFGLKIVDLDSMSISSVPLSNYQAASPGLGQGLEYGAIADQLYMAPVAGDSLYQIDYTTGVVSAVQEIPGFANTYSYLHTFYQSEQRYAMISTDAQGGQKRFFQVGLDTLDNDSLSLFSIFPDSQMVNRIAFPFPKEGWFGLEATNTQFLARMVQNHNNGNTTGIFDRPTPPPFRVYPNPASAWINIEYPQAQATQMKLWDLHGRVVRRVNFNRDEATRLSLEGLARGTYLLGLKGVGYVRVVVE